MNKVIFTLLLSVISTMGFAQCDSLAGSCEKHISQKYISDGQAYRALLTGQEVAEFKTTLFGGNTYRFAACSGESDGNLVFRIYDQDKNLLFTNKEYSNSPFWDFVIENTMVVSVEANLDQTRLASGCAVIIIGFKK